MHKIHDTSSSGRTSPKILAVAFEPWETEITASVNKRLKDLNNGLSTKLFIADFWQIHRKKPAKNLKRIGAQYDTEFFDLEAEFISWQDVRNSSVDYEERLLHLMRKNQIVASSRVLEFSDHIFSCFERSPYYRPVTRQQRSAILFFYARKIEQTLDDYRPTIVWTIERNYLAKNIFAAMCEARAIPMATLIYSRLKNIWYFTSEFVTLPHCGPSDTMAPQQPKTTGHPADQSSGEAVIAALDFIKDWREKFEQDKSTLYRGGTEQTLGTLSKSASSLLSRRLNDTIKTIRRLGGSLKNRNGDKVKMPRGFVYTGDWWRTSLYLLNQWRRRSMYDLFGLPLSMNTVPQVPFFYYPLHHRPESSTLTLGRGMTDEAAIGYILRFLPHGCVLAVKENPMIVADRPRRFYRRILGDPRIMLLDPLVPTQLLIRNCLGVISVSGTALLEAALIGKPAHAVGKPEFFRHLNSTGLDGIEAFLVSCATGGATSCAENAELYVQSVFSVGQSLALGWQALEPEKLRQNTEKIAAMLQKYFDDVGAAMPREAVKPRTDQKTLGVGHNDAQEEAHLT